MTNAYLELTIRIDTDSHPRLHAYLSAREPGRRRAAALKRLAEDALQLAGMRGAAEADRRPFDGATAAPSRVTASEVRSSLAQFSKGEKP